MSNPILIGAKLGMKRTSLTTLDGIIEAIKIRADEATEAIDSA